MTLGPIYNRDAEQGSNARALEGDPNVVPALRGEQFHAASDRMLFEAIKAAGSKTADVEKYLGARKIYYLHDVPVAAYIAEIVDRFAWGKDSSFYVQGVIEAWRARTIETALTAAAVRIRRLENVDRVVGDLGRAIRAARESAAPIASARRSA